MSSSTRSHGSGTTLVVARKLDRRYLGFELSPDYAAQAQGRLDATLIGDPLSGGEQPHVTPKRRRKDAGSAGFFASTS